MITENPKFQAAAAALIAELANPQATRITIRNAAMEVIVLYFEDSQYDQAQLFWHRLINGLNSLS